MIFVGARSSRNVSVLDPPLLLFISTRLAKNAIPYPLSGVRRLVSSGQTMMHRFGESGTSRGSQFLRVLDMIICFIYDIIFIGKIMM